MVGSHAHRIIALDGADALGVFFSCASLGVDPLDGDQTPLAVDQSMALGGLGLQLGIKN